MDGYVFCTAEEWGDPAPDVVKSCYCQYVAEIWSDSGNACTDAISSGCDRPNDDGYATQTYEDTDIGWYYEVEVNCAPFIGGAVVIVVVVLIIVICVIAVVLCICKKFWGAICKKGDAQPS